MPEPGSIQQTIVEGEETQYDSDQKKEPDFGLLFDIDGVLARGLNPIPQAVEMIELLKDKNGQLRVPLAFVTNACNKQSTKADQISRWFNIPCTPEQAIHSQSPLSVFTHWHDKFALFVGQGAILEIARDLGFKNVCTIDEIADAYPLLDMVDHANRRTVAKGYVEKEFPRVEVIVLIGEPVRWDKYLQLLIDLLVTNGKPDHSPEEFPEKHLPIIACNMDLVFMAEAKMPRFGHGAFLVCLEHLYEKITGYQLIYSAISGKPSEISYRFAEHTLSEVAKNMGITNKISKIYFFGDNPEADIVGANLYNSYLRRFRRLSGQRPSEDISHEERGELRKKAAVASSRIIPEEAQFSPQTVRSIDSILVRTGVYKPSVDGKKSKKPSYLHRDFGKAGELVMPTLEVDDVLEGIKHVLLVERFNPKLVD